MSIWDARSDYGKQELDAHHLPDDPAQLVEKWLSEAIAAGVPDANAMALSTVTAAGFPATRIVLLREQKSHEFRFYTNYESHKGQALAQNNKACLLFFWQPLERQIRITGHCERLSRQDSDTYFNSRPRASQLSAWASHQSEPIANREALMEKMAVYDKQFPDTVPRPDYWGGYGLVATEYEFWQGQANRLHDRFLYSAAPENPTQWLTKRLAP